MKFVVSDLDGTLLESHDTISNYTKLVIRKLIKRGINFAIATGRGKKSVEKLLKELEIKTYLICNNGANIYDKNGKIIFETTITPELTSQILKTIRKNNLYFSAFKEENFYKCKGDLNEYGASKIFKENIIENLEDSPEVNKIIVVDKDPSVIKNISDILKEKYASVVEITISQPTCVDISPKGCNKGEGIKQISKIFNIPLMEFMAFGDGENDIEMLKIVGVPVIMGNSQEILKNNFTNIAKTNKENGVAEYIVNYFNLLSEDVEK